MSLQLLKKLFYDFDCEVIILLLLGKMGIIAEKYRDLNSEKDTPIKSYVNGKQCKKKCQTD